MQLLVLCTEQSKLIISSWVAYTRKEAGVIYYAFPDQWCMDLPTWKLSRLASLVMEARARNEKQQTILVLGRKKIYSQAKNQRDKVTVIIKGNYKFPRSRIQFASRPWRRGITEQDFTQASQTLIGSNRVKTKEKLYIMKPKGGKRVKIARHVKLLTLNLWHGCQPIWTENLQ